MSRLETAIERAFEIAATTIESLTAQLAEVRAESARLAKNIGTMADDLAYTNTARINAEAQVSALSAEVEGLTDDVRVLKACYNDEIGAHVAACIRAALAEGRLQQAAQAIQQAEQKHFDASNAKPSPEWQRKAHAHAWAGLLEAKRIVDSQITNEPAPVQPPEAAADQFANTCEDRRLLSAAYTVCGSNGDREWHWRPPGGPWRAGFRSEDAAVRAALKHLSGVVQPSTDGEG